MRRYNGGPIACKFYLEQYELHGEQYYSIGSHCADVLFNLTDCNGVSRCEDSQATWCIEFFEHAIRNGIVAVGRD